jgi:hypothetical protein
MGKTGSYANGILTVRPFKKVPDYEKFIGFNSPDKLFFCVIGADEDRQRSIEQAA